MIEEGPHLDLLELDSKIKYTVFSYYQLKIDGFSYKIVSFCREKALGMYLFYFF